MNQLNLVEDRKITITGHRGAAGLAPENTLASIEKAMELKVDRIEVDVQQTKDQVVILMHDKTLDRTTNGQGKVINYTYEELKQFTIGEGIKIPTLEEAIQTINQQSVLLIEIKEGDDYYPDIEKNIIALIHKHQAQDWCIIQSFSDRILKKVHELAPEIPLHKLLVTGFLYNFKKLPYVEEYSVFHRFTTRRLVKRVHRLGKKINCWTVNEKSKADKLIKKNIDGLITDYPSTVYTPTISD